MENVIIRPATLRNVPGVQRLARANDETFGFLPLVTIKKGQEDGELLVALQKTGDAEAVIGFLRFHVRRDGQATLYDICTHARLRGQGIGTRLLQTFFAHCREKGCSSVQLKCVIGTRANDFYRKHGFILSGMDPGKKRSLNIWTYTLEETHV